jgi:hypothetical protein
MGAVDVACLGMGAVELACLTMGSVELVGGPNRGRDRRAPHRHLPSSSGREAKTGGATRGYGWRCCTGQRRATLRGRRQNPLPPNRVDLDLRPRITGGCAPLAPPPPFPHPTPSLSARRRVASNRSVQGQHGDGPRRDVAPASCHAALSSTRRRAHRASSSSLPTTDCRLPCSSPLSPRGGRRR